MFEPMITVIGNVLTEPEWRRTAVTGTYVVSFRFASTSRRLDKATGRWVDGDGFRVKVACWRRLGENVFDSVQVGDPLVIHGRLYSRDWTDAHDRKHTSYELDASSIGHDLARGVSRFARRKAVAAAESVDDPVNVASLGGEPTERVPAPPRPADLPPVAALLERLDDRYDTAPVPPPGFTLSATEELEDRDGGDDDESDVDTDEIEDEEVAVAA